MKSWIELQSVVKKKHQQISIDRISLKIESGSFSVILGKNNSGKSLLLKILAGIENYQQGDRLVNGSSVYLSYELLKKECESIGWKYRLKSELKKSHALMLQQYLERLGLKSLNLKTKPHLAEYLLMKLAFAMAQDKKVLLLDEVLMYADIEKRMKIFEVLREFCKQGGSVVIATNHIEQSRETDHLIYLDQGHLIYSGSVKEISEKFIKVRTREAPGALGLSHETILECLVPIGRNQDQTRSYIASREDFKRLSLPLAYPDLRSVDLEEMVLYLTKIASNQRDPHKIREFKKAA